MSKIFFCLDVAIKKMHVTPNRVAVEAKIPPNSIYKMIENKTTRIHTDTLKSLLDALNKISLEEKLPYFFSIEDVIKYKK